jgi:hypothetical protein
LYIDSYWDLRVKYLCFEVKEGAIGIKQLPEFNVDDKKEMVG